MANTAMITVKIATTASAEITPNTRAILLLLSVKNIIKTIIIVLVEQYITCSGSFAGICYNTKK